jgi:hypothetical protein
MASAAGDAASGTEPTQERSSRGEGIDSDEYLSPNILWYFRIILAANFALRFADFNIVVCLCSVITLQFQGLFTVYSTTARHLQPPAAAPALLWLKFGPVHFMKHCPISFQALQHQLRCSGKQTGTTRFQQNRPPPSQAPRSLRKLQCSTKKILAAWPGNARASAFNHLESLPQCLILFQVHVCSDSQEYAAASGAQRPHVAWLRAQFL